MIKLNVLLTEVTEFCIAGIHDLSLDLEKVNHEWGFYCYWSSIGLQWC